eukprot:jgi/Tetstr1/425112/TSEL_015574.t1
MGNLLAVRRHRKRRRARALRGRQAHHHHRLCPSAASLPSSCMPSSLAIARARTTRAPAPWTIEGNGTSFTKYGANDTAHSGGGALVQLTDSQVEQKPPSLWSHGGDISFFPSTRQAL